MKSDNSKKQYSMFETEQSRFFLSFNTTADSTNHSNIPDRTSLISSFYPFDFKITVSWKLNIALIIDAAYNVSRKHYIGFENYFQ